MRFGRLLLEWHAVPLAAAFVLDRFAAWPVSLAVLPRPLIVALGGATLLVLISRLVLRNPGWAALAAGALVSVVFLDPILMLVYAALLAWQPALRLLRLGRGAHGRRSRGEASAEPVRVAAFASTVLLVLALVRVAGSGAITLPQPSVSAASEAVAASRPNVHLILLDGYPRADTLRDTFGYDNEPFLSELEAIGFEVAHDARSNYTKTGLTLASMFNGSYVGDLPGAGSSVASQYRAIQPIINRSELLGTFQSHGYRIRSVASAFSTIALERADVVIESGRLNEFEVALAQNSVAGRVGVLDLREMLAWQARSAVEENLAAARFSADQPTFSFVHVMSPHPPFVLGTDDPVAHVPACFPISCGLWEPSVGVTDVPVAEYAAGMRDQLDGLNPLVLKAVRDIVERDPGAIVIVMSDHGARYSLDDPDEQVRSLFAARTPGHDGLFPADVAPVNVLRGVLTAYLGEDLAPLEYRGWLSDHDLPLDMIEIEADDRASSAGERP